MTESVRQFLARIGRKGGQASRRALDPEIARRMVRLREARRAFKKFRTQCFWFVAPDFQVGFEDIPWVAEQLMKHGGREAWLAGGKLLASLTPEAGQDLGSPVEGISCLGGPMRVLALGLPGPYLRPMHYRDIITLEPGKRSGKPCIRGLRITVYDVLASLASGMSVDDLLSDFPELTREDVQACLAYAADLEHRTVVIPA